MDSECGKQRSACLSFSVVPREQKRVGFFLSPLLHYAQCCLKTFPDIYQTLEILSTYRDDFAKYAGRADKGCLGAVLINVARKVGQQIKYTQLSDGHTGPTNRKAFDLLCMARVTHKIPSANPTALPLGASAGEKRFKAGFLDIGLMQRACGLPVDREMQHRDLLNIYRGQLAEQFVAQELLVTHERELFYWSREARGSQAEVDFLVVQDGVIHPLEVKSGHGGQLRSLHMVLRAYPECGNGMILSSSTYGELPDQKLLFLPLYYAGSLGPKAVRIGDHKL